VDDLNIPKLSAYEMSKGDFPEAIEKTMTASSFKGNPVALNEKELAEILEKAL
jgi:alcohol dehydrogenase class IV